MVLTNGVAGLDLRLEENLAGIFQRNHHIFGVGDIPDRRAVGLVLRYVGNRFEYGLQKVHLIVHNSWLT